MNDIDVVVAGAGAAGMMCAIEAGKRGRRVALLEHNNAPGEKIRISGGGRCNFTNRHTAPANFISGNPHFCKSALKRYTPADFIAKVDAKGITWFEKSLGQLFCHQSATQIVAMLMDECRDASVELHLETSVGRIEPHGDGWRVHIESGFIDCASLVIATGGKSIPKMGATDFAFRTAEQFGLKIVETRPALVPLTFAPDLLEQTKPLSGISAEAIVSCRSKSFREAMLFTHRGISGPSILQISSYWREGDEIEIDLAPGIDIYETLRAARQSTGKIAPHTALSEFISKRLAESVALRAGVKGKLGEFSDARLKSLSSAVKHWRLKPVGSEGYRTAEVTLGGIDTDGLSSKTMEARSRPGLYFIGEAVDVTGWLGGYNFQWAWASGWAAGQAV